VLPPRLQHIQPIPTEVQIDLGKLNSLIQDPLVRSIECDGPEQNVMVRGATNESKTTAIVLNEEEIIQIIDIFSKSSKIPVSGGVFRVVVGKLVLSAITSEVVGSKFIIRKLMLPRTPMYPAMPRRPENFRR
jgi:type IV secretory pathway ATPase VirB11/archaellum biosynthesis ATPase